ncbi:DUF6602 domain-containing protein [Pseudomonas syringae]|uniref:DUF6602 domain-containing protein n=1 Tax=Pseudomonas syringae TaxID=317 RepID=UPI001BCFA89D|nr:DUF6602 domain-containing protein [Pseudomonas syringae]MBS7413951.1 hypothetical protein [Pseudomonas syringae]QVI74712.1 hypothetical protein KHW13_20925 [Pseudomonas syringae]
MDIKLDSEDHMKRLSLYMEEDFKNSADHLKTITLIRALDSTKDTLIHEYSYLQKTVKGDPGTAGKECQNVFARFLKKYLPKDIKIIVDGIIILDNGKPSPQVDLILVKDLPEALDGSYIPQEYVIAAFEVKLTLYKSHFEKILETAAALRPIARQGSPREVLFGRIVYGVLALSSKIKDRSATNIEKTLKVNEDECDSAHKVIGSLLTPAHPSQTIDLIFVADAFSLSASKTINYSERYPNEFPDIQLSYHYSLANNSNIIGAGGLARILCTNPRNNHIGAFLYRLFLILHREGAVSERSAAAFFYFDSSIAFGSHSWDINSLGEKFKRDWTDRIDDETIEWSNIHPQ